MANVTVYYEKNRRGVWKASLDYKKLMYFDDYYTAELPVVHDKVYMTLTFFGFDYDATGINNITRRSETIYHSVHSLKKNCEVWKKRAEMAEKNPDDFHVTPFSIASDDCGEPFEYGDVMEGKFNMKIIGIKVI